MIVVRLVLRQAAVLIAAGLVLGLLGSALFARLITGLLYGREPFGSADVCRGLVAFSRRSSPGELHSCAPRDEVDPLIALRYE
jgi:hypothetical protein